MPDLPGDSHSEKSGNSFADRLNYLFETIYPAGRGQYKNPEVAAAICESGESITSNYIWMLRTKRRANPTMRHVAALAKFFGVPPSYFFDDADAEDIKQQLEILSAAREADVKEIFYRSTQLNEPDRNAVLRILRSLGKHSTESPGEPND